VRIKVGAPIESLAIANVLCGLNSSNTNALIRVLKVWRKHACICQRDSLILTVRVHGPDGGRMQAFH